jgi:hypothetical protein
MFLQLSHTRLDIFKVSKSFVLNCYRETKTFPPEEKFGIVQQIRRAALKYITQEKLNELGQFMIRSFQMISKMIS